MTSGAPKLGGRGEDLEKITCLPCGFLTLNFRVCVGKRTDAVCPECRQSLIFVPKKFS